MAWLFWPATYFAQSARLKEVKAHYASVEEAIAQAEHDKNLPNPKTPLRVEDDDGTIVWTP